MARTERCLKLSAVYALVICLLAFTGCGGGGTTEESIIIAGSQTVTPIIEKCRGIFISKNNNVSVSIETTNSSKGIQAVMGSQADIGMSSRDLTEKEKNSSLTPYTIGYDALAVVVNPKNPVRELSLKQLKGIYTGQIKNWKELGGKDMPINVVTRPTGQGSRAVFDEIVGMKEAEAEFTIIERNDYIGYYVAESPNAIVYISMGYLTDAVKALKIEGTKPTVSTIKSKEYKLSRPLLVVTKPEVKPVVAKFLDFMQSDEGQRIVASQGFVPLK